MSYTVLRVTERGVLFRTHHARRMERGGPGAREAFDAFCAGAEPGIHVLRFEHGGLQAERRASSRLHAGIGIRWCISPFAGTAGRFPKPAPPSGYDAVRAAGVATLLTDPSGEELFEACSASVIAWTGAGWIAAPKDRPRVESVAEAALEEAGLLTFAPIRVRERPAIALLNAVLGVCTVDPAQLPSPPAEAVTAVEQALLATVR